ncbi:MAG: carbohydrate deacetylase [Patescibacteria group bacterium]
MERAQARFDMARFLIVNADDFGLTAGVNRGIVYAHTNGIVTSTTLMVNMPGFADAVALAGRTPGLAVGLHLNLTYGRPVLPPWRVPSLVDSEGAFVRDPRYVIDRGRVEEIEAEFAAQAERFTATGLALSHLDSHHHLHAEVKFLAPMARLAQKAGVTVRCLDRQALLARGVAPRAGFVKFFGDENGVARLSAIFAGLPEGATEIPCHPGFVDDELMALSTLNTIRERELAALTDPRTLAAAQAEGIQLTSYPGLCGAAG